jgi:hypothetical protein
VLSAEAGVGAADHLIGAGDASALIETPSLEARPMRSPERAPKHMKQ